MAKLTELEREEFLNEVKENWTKWKNPTKVHELIKYMIDNAFTKKAESTLTSLSKEQLKDIILNGDEESGPGESQNTKSGLGAELIDFLEEAKLEIHKNSFNKFVKKHSIKLIDKLAEKVDDSIIDKLGVFSMVLMALLLFLELLFKNGFKDVFKKLKELREKRKGAKTLDAEVVE